MGAFAGVAEVAALVFGACPLGSVVVVAEVPWLAGVDGLLALGAVHAACLDPRGPLFPE